jgi:hypothetical protein
MHITDTIQQMYQLLARLEFEQHALAAEQVAVARATIEPVPVSERLPGPEDCDAEGRCWWLTLAVIEGGRGGYSTFWELTTFKAAVRCASHWLPHNALPVPGAEVPPMPELRAASAEARPAGLVERVANAISGEEFGGWHPEARGAILEVAAAAKERIAPFNPWLRWNDVAQWLEQEANQ